MINKVVQSYNADNVTKLHYATTEENLAYYGNDKVTTVASGNNTNSAFPISTSFAAIDSNNSTAWISPSAPSVAQNNAQTLIVDLGSNKSISGFKTDFWLLQRAHKYKIYYMANDTSNWSMRERGHWQWINQEIQLQVQ